MTDMELLALNLRIELDLPDGYRLIPSEHYVTVYGMTYCFVITDVYANAHMFRDTLDVVGSALQELRRFDQDKPDEPWPTELVAEIGFQPGEPWPIKVVTPSVFYHEPL